MATYKDRILKAIEESEDGLTTVDVAKQAGVSKTTVIKYLSVLKSEGLCQYVEVGPSKLWRATTNKVPPKDECSQIRHMKISGQAVDTCEVDSLSVTSLDDRTFSDDATVSLSFKIKSDQIISLIRQIKKCNND